MNKVRFFKPLALMIAGFMLMGDVFSFLKASPSLTAPPLHLALEMFSSEGLKARQPNWRVQIDSCYANGNALSVTLFETRELLGSKVNVIVKKLEYYPEGQLFRETDFDGQMQQGKWVSFEEGVQLLLYEDGTLMKRSLFHQGRLHGPCISYHPNGQTSVAKCYYDGKLDGQEIGFSEQGEQIFSRAFEHGLLEGNNIEYWPNGLLKHQAVYHKGLIEGAVEEWDDQGRLVSRLLFLNGLLHNDVDGSYAFYKFYPDLSVKERQSFYLGIKQGVCEKFYSGGQLKYTCRYRGGQKWGKEIFYSREGKETGGGLYKGGIAVGHHVRRHSNGSLSYLAVYDDLGRLIQPIEELDEKGAKTRNYQLVKGQLEGKYVEWYPNGTIKKEREWNQGLLDGIQKNFTQSGQQILSAEYRSGKREGPYQEWYSDGKMKVNAHYTRDLLDGPVIFYYPSGQKKYEGHYHGGVIDGKEVSWFVNGSNQSVSYWEKGKLNGMRQKWTDQGNLLLQEHWKRGEEHGELCQWHENSNQCLSRVTFVDGKKQGLEQEFYLNGKLAYQAYYSEGLLQGQMHQWFEDGSDYQVRYYEKGKPSKEHVIYYPHTDQGTVVSLHLRYDDQGKLHGEQQQFWPNGKPKMLAYYNHGLLNGKKSLWDENNKLIFEGVYTLGDLQGKIFQVLPNGLEIIRHYQDGLLDGSYLVYYPYDPVFGKVKALEAFFKKGVIEGEINEFNEAGTKVMGCQYVNGKREGDSCYYSDKGRLFQKVCFEKDVQVKESIVYYPDGSIHMKGFFVQGKQSGEEVCYHPHGMCASKRYYQAGKLHGLCQEWNEMGVLIFEAEYNDGCKNGKLNKYYEDGSPKLLQVYQQDKLVSKKVFNESGAVIKEVR